MPIELKVPPVGESVLEAVVSRWLKAEGQYVDKDEPVVELETDKASFELPAPVSGTIQQIVKPQGTTVKIGEVIGYMEEEPPETEVAGAGLRTRVSVAAAAEAQETSPANSRVMPAARRALATHGLREDQVTPTGPGGRLLKQDVEQHVQDSAQRRADTTPAPPDPVPSASSDRPEKVVPMTPLRQTIARRLLEAQQTSAMLTTFNEIDMSAVSAVRARYRDDFEAKYGIRLGFMSFFVKASIEALQAIPVVNAEVRGDSLVYKGYFDIGVAVSTDRGLVVPVVRHADQLSFAELERSIADLAKRAKEKKIELHELQGGTFTITNGGVFGSLLSTPILNPPQAAVLGMHAVQERPVVRDHQIVVRPMMYVALTYDHRIIDGREAVTFLRMIKERIEDPVRILIEA